MADARAAVHAKPASNDPAVADVRGAEPPGKLSRHANATRFPLPTDQPIHRATQYTGKNGVRSEIEERTRADMTAATGMVAVARVLLVKTAAETARVTYAATTTNERNNGAAVNAHASAMLGTAASSGSHLA
jgi:hypothetical protein